MAVKAENFKKTFDKQHKAFVEKHQELVKSFEINIDNRLNTGDCSIKDYCIEMDINFPYSIVMDLKPIYKKAGWDLQYYGSRLYLKPLDKTE